MANTDSNIAFLERSLESLYGEKGVLTKVFKATGATKEGSATEDNETAGLMPWPFDPEEVRHYRYNNVQQGRAIEAKVAAIN